jgi:hypothetical protein
MLKKVDFKHHKRLLLAILKQFGCNKKHINRVQSVSQPGGQGVFCMPNFPKTHTILTNSNMEYMYSEKHGIAHSGLAKCTP